MFILFRYLYSYSFIEAKTNKILKIILFTNKNNKIQ